MTTIATNPWSYVSAGLANLSQLFSQTPSTDTATSTSTSSTGAAGAGSNLMTPPPSPSGMFSSDILSQLFASQENTPSNLAAQAISSADTDGDGSLSLSEVENSLASSLGDSSASDLSAGQTTAITDAFNSLDTNGDGELSASELAAGITATEPSGPPMPPELASASSGSDALENLFGAESQTPSNVAAQLISSDDTNGDGTLSLSEVESALASSLGDASASDLTTAQTTAITNAFNSLDTNGDGQLSASELTTGIDNLEQAQGSGQVHGHHHHHHHMASQDAASSTATTDSSTDSTSATDASTADASTTTTTTS